MTIIRANFGDGGNNLAPRASGSVTLAATLRDIADDLADLQVALIASPDATDLPSAITLLNEIKGALNALAGATVRTQKG